MRISLFGKEFWLGHKPDEALTKEEAEAFIAKEVEAFKKSFTYDKLFTTGHLLDIVNSTRVTNPYETVATVYKSVRAICDNVIEADPQLYQKQPNGKHGEPIDDVPFHVFLQNPNPRQSFQEFMQEWIGYYELHGEGFILKTPSIGQIAGTYGLPASIENLNPAYMTEVVDHATNTLTSWRYKNGQIIDPKWVIHTKDFNPNNQWRGLSRIKPIYDELMIDTASINWNLQFFRNDATPGFAVSTDLSLNDEQRNRLEEWWNRRHKGTRNAFKFAIFEKGLKPVTITPTHKDMDFISQKDQMRKEIMGIWRVPEALFNMTADVNYATFMGQMRVFWIYTLIPALGKFASTMNKGVITPYRQDAVYDHDLSGVAAFQEQLGELITIGKDMWGMGYTADEINEKLNLGMPTDKVWRKEGWVPWNIITAQDALDNPRIAQNINDPTGAAPTSAPDPGGSPRKKPPEDNPTEEDSEAAKTVKNEKFRLELINKSFDRRQAEIEKLMQRRLESYFKKLGEIASKTKDHQLEKGIVAIDWDKANAYLEKTVKPIMAMAVNEGVSHGKEVVSRQKSINENQLSQSLESFIAVKMDQVKNLNQTIRDQLSDVLGQAIQDGLAHATARDAILANMTESMKGVFHNAVTRAALIARTESVSAVNGGANIYYKNMGIEKKRWITAHDSLVRETHSACEDEGAIPMGDTFQANGMEFPGEPGFPAEEVCNCRCRMAPAGDY